MTPKTTALTALALALATTASADLFGLGGADLEVGDTPVDLTSVPDAHWQFRPSGATTAVNHFSANLDSLGFDNASKCFGHTLLTIRWFQYITKPLKNGTVSAITPDEFRDFWGGKMDYVPSYDITAANVDGERLQPYSMYNDWARTAVGKLVGYYHQYQHNDWDHDLTKHDDPGEFRRSMERVIRDQQLPPQIWMRRDGGAHAINGFKITEGTAVWDGSAEGDAGRQRAWKISVYDPNAPGSGDAGDDAAYEGRYYMVVFEDGSGLVGLGEQQEFWYDRYLRQSSANPEGTWHIPDERYGLYEDASDDSGEIRSGFWHWWNDVEDVDDAEARRIAGLDAAD